MAPKLWDPKSLRQRNTKFNSVSAFHHDRAKRRLCCPSNTEVSLVANSQNMLHAKNKLPACSACMVSMTSKRFERAKQSLELVLSSCLFCLNSSVEKRRITILGVPIIRIIVFGGSIVGSSYLAKLPTWPTCNASASSLLTLRAICARIASSWSSEKTFRARGCK